MLAIGRGGPGRVAAPQILHRRHPQVVLRVGAEPLLGLDEPAHAGTAVVGPAAGAFSARSAASPFCAAIAIGSNSAPIGGE